MTIDQVLGKLVEGLGGGGVAKECQWREEDEETSEGGLLKWLGKSQTWNEVKGELRDHGIHRLHR